MAESRTNVGHPRRRLTFSLSSLLLGTALIVLSVSYFAAMRELRTVREEVASVRDQFGELTIGDRTRVHVISVPTPESNAWRWRVFVPDGSQLRWGIGHGLIPNTGVSDPNSAGTRQYFFDNASPGEQVVVAKLYQNGQGIWSISLSIDAPGRMNDATFTYSLQTGDIPWLDGSAFVATKQAGLRGTTVRNSNRPVVLLRHRAAKHDSLPKDHKKSDPSPGIMIWLDPDS